MDSKSMNSETKHAFGVNEINLSFGPAQILYSVSWDAPAGSMVGIIGPNGCGKSTVLRTAYRALKPNSGLAFIGNEDVWKISARQSAREIAVVTQESNEEFDFTVYDVAALGRTPHKGPFDRDTDEDREIILKALDDLGLIHLAHRPISQVSGGEKQRALIARALIQQTKILVLDEPTNHLDIKYQIDILSRVSSLNMTVVAALHDLNLASQWCDFIVLMKQGRIHSFGPTSDVLTEQSIEEVFDVRALSVSPPETGRGYFIFEEKTDV